MLGIVFGGRCGAADDSSAQLRRIASAPLGTFVLGAVISFSLGGYPEGEMERWTPMDSRHLNDEL